MRWYLQSLNLIDLTVACNINPCHCYLLKAMKTIFIHPLICCIISLVLVTLLTCEYDLKIKDISIDLNQADKVQLSSLASKVEYIKVGQVTRGETIYPISKVYSLSENKFLINERKPLERNNFYVLDDRGNILNSLVDRKDTIDLSLATDVSLRGQDIVVLNYGKGALQYFDHKLNLFRSTKMPDLYLKFYPLDDTHVIYETNGTSLGHNNHALNIYNEINGNSVFCLDVDPKLEMGENYERFSYSLTEQQAYVYYTRMFDPFIYQLTGDECIPKYKYKFVGRDILINQDELRRYHEDFSAIPEINQKILRVYSLVELENGLLFFIIRKDNLQTWVYYSYRKKTTRLFQVVHNDVDSGPLPYFVPLGVAQPNKLIFKVSAAEMVKYGKMNASSNDNDYFRFIVIMRT